MQRSDSRRLARKFLIVCLLAAAVLLLQPRRAAAECCDPIFCSWGCDGRLYWTCYMQCSSYGEPYRTQCMEQCDAEYFACVAWCWTYCIPCP